MKLSALKGKVCIRYLSCAYYTTARLPNLNGFASNPHSFSEANYLPVKDGFLYLFKFFVVFSLHYTVKRNSYAEQSSTTNQSCRYKKGWRFILCFWHCS